MSPGDEVKDKAKQQQEQEAESPGHFYVKVGLDQETKDFFKNLKPGDRLTITLPDGTVLYDSAKKKEEE